ncbi:MAG: hypothetical protein Q8889_02090 [Candidatus Phytoplasma australasiaticum]|nr:hypothetical protein [Candidatus Phytoplasma australasiaticum]
MQKKSFKGIKIDVFLWSHVETNWSHDGVKKKSHGGKLESRRSQNVGNGVKKSERNIWFNGSKVNIG